MKAPWLKKFVLLSLVVVWLAVGSSRWASSSPLDASQLFEVHCAGCHPQGGNILRRGKTLKLKALKSNHFETAETIAQLITQGKGNMTAFGDRLSASEIQGLSEYVLIQATTDWKG
jgi:cytochrome c6